jgi:hypothetical protein
MSMLSFLPWANLTERIQVGGFEIAPFSKVHLLGDIPADLLGSADAVLEAYRPRQVDRKTIPILRLTSTSFTSDLSEPQIEELFEFRQRLAFAVLAKRRFFSHRYANSDHVRLVVQGFTAEGSGTTSLISRRRDGSTKNLISRGMLAVRRPEHVAFGCELPGDLDLPLLESLENAYTRKAATWDRVADTVRLFVGANTDSPEVSLHSELIDTVSAFSRLAGVWDEQGTVSEFIRELPSPEPVNEEFHGSKFTLPAVTSALAKGRPVRAAWLKDAYVLRSQYGHGHVTTPPYRSSWSIHEHLLLGAIVLPLYVKAVLGREGLYTTTDEDRALDAAFDTLATLEPFASDPESDAFPWRNALSHFEIHQWFNTLRKGS